MFQASSCKRLSTCWSTATSCDGGCSPGPRTRGGSTTTRPTIAHRLEVYDTETAPILAFYANRGLVVDVDGNQPVEAVFSDIVKTVEAVRAGLR